MGANMGTIWGRQDPGGPHVGPMNFAIWAALRKAKRVELFTSAKFNSNQMLYNEILGNYSCNIGGGGVWPIGALQIWGNTRVHLHFLSLLETEIYHEV